MFAWVIVWLIGWFCASVPSIPRVTVQVLPETLVTSKASCVEVPIPNTAVNGVAGQLVELLTVNEVVVDPMAVVRKVCGTFVAYCWPVGIGDPRSCLGKCGRREPDLASLVYARRDR